MQTIVKHAQRKACDTTDIPVEACLLIFRKPYVSNDQHWGHAGIDAKASEPDMVAFREMLIKFLAIVLASGRVPWCFTGSIAWLLPRNMAVIGCGAWRMIHGLPTIARALIKVLWDMQEVVDELPLFAFGGIPGRSREEPVLGQLLLAHRVRASGGVLVSDFHDITFAFQSTATRVYLDVINVMTDSPAKSILKQFVSEGFFRMEYENSQHDYFKLSSGILAGGPIACQIFNRAFDRSMQGWLETAAIVNPSMNTCSITTSQDIQLGTFSFVDDLVNSTIGSMDEFKKNNSSLFRHQVRKPAPPPPGLGGYGGGLRLIQVAPTLGATPPPGSTLDVLVLDEGIQ